MASQPLSSSIRVYRSLRGQRGAVRHESVKALTSFQRPLELQIPGVERPQVYNTNVDATRKGVTSYDRLGLPIVVGVRAVKDFNAVETLTGIDFPIEIGHDRFVVNTAAGLASSTSSDLFTQAQAL